MKFMNFSRESAPNVTRLGCVFGDICFDLTKAIGDDLVEFPRVVFTLEEVLAVKDGLQLLEDLGVFNPDIVAILITGYAHQATPLDAMRMGVRDYLDKNQDFNRDSFLAAVRKQLERIRPAKRERLLHARLVAFREAVQKVVPLVRSAAALSDPLEDTFRLSRLGTERRQVPVAIEVEISGRAQRLQIAPFQKFRRIGVRDFDLFERPRRGSSGLG